MRILYSAKHDKRANDNEGAIAHALQELGHDVTCVHERSLAAEWAEWRVRVFDLLLFQNWKPPLPDLTEAAWPKVFWYMDRVDYGDDQILRSWTESRLRWMRTVIPQVTVGVCTDGDWVSRDATGKLMHLMQGCDERVAKLGLKSGNDIPLLFMGMIYGRGEGRSSWFKELQSTYGGKFHYKRKCFGRDLIRAIHQTKIVLAPDGPVSDRYFSNRLFVVCSFGGFLLHPFCAHAAELYEDGREVVFYRDRQHMHELIRHYLTRPAERWAIQKAGFERTMREHTYRHRLEVILREVDARCLTG